MNFSILISFLDLVDVLINSPNSSMRIEKINDLQKLFINMNHLMTELRAHEILKTMMETEKHQTMEAADELDHEMVEIRQMLQNATINLPDNDSVDSDHVCTTSVNPNNKEIALQVSTVIYSEDRDP